jgi:hypothetical protein
MPNKDEEEEEEEEEGEPRRDADAPKDVVVIVNDGTVVIAMATAQRIHPRTRRGGEDDDAIVGSTG